MTDEFGQARSSDRDFGSMSQPPSTAQPPVVETRIICPNCEYNLTGVAIGSACPECGLVIGRGLFAGASLPTSGKAVAALVLGIVSIIGCSFYGVLSIPCGIVAIVLARSVKGQVIRNEVSPTSDSLAKAGSICGIIGLSLGGLTLLVFALFVIAGMSGGF